MDALKRFAKTGSVLAPAGFRSDEVQQLPVLCTAGPGDVNRPDTSTMGTNLTAAEQRQERPAPLRLKRCFGGPEGTRQPRVSV